MTTAQADFKLIETQVIELHERWMSYGLLFADPAQRRRLNGVAPAASSLVAELFREGILSSLFRLTDQEGKPPNENVTLRRLAALCPSRQEELQARVDALIERVKPLRKLRNKLVGHMDLARARRDGVQTVAEFEEGEIDEVLAEVRSVVDTVRNATVGNIISFDYRVNTVDEVEHLLRRFDAIKIPLSEG